MTIRINGVARALLEIHGPALGMDLIHLTDVLPATELRLAIRSALAGRPTVTIHRVSSADLPTDEVRHLRLTTSPHRSVVDGEIDGALLVIMDVSAAEQHRSAAASLTEKVDLAVQQQQRLIVANRDLAAINDELQLANEDFLFNAEEAQAGREEMETLAEEMQATNEELETLNEELQATNEELETANDELASQASVLAEQRADLAMGRDRLASIIEGMGDALLMVDRDGATVVSNGAYERLFGMEGLVLADEAGVPLPHDLTVQTAFDVSAAAAALERDRPSVALCDIVLDGVEAGFDLLARFGGKGGTAFILFSAHDVSGFYARAVRLGAAGFVPKTASAEEILVAVRRAAGGSGVPDPRTLRRAKLAPPEPTARELEIIRLVVVGRQNGEIATELAVTRKTVEGHLRRLFDRYDVRTRTALATLARGEGWVAP